MKGMSIDLRYDWARFDKLQIEDKILGIKVSVKDCPTTQFYSILPHAFRLKILVLTHSSAAGGHLNIQKTFYNLKQRFY